MIQMPYWSSREYELFKSCWYHIALTHESVIREDQQQGRALSRGENLQQLGLSAPAHAPHGDGREAVLPPFHTRAFRAHPSL